MKILAVLFVLGYVSQVLSVPLPNMSPAMQTLLMDMIQKLMNQGAIGPMKMKPHLLPPPVKPPMPQYMPPSIQPPVQPMPPPTPSYGNNGVFMDMPSAGGSGGYAYSMNSVYCPPGPTSSDSCKDQKLIEALYYPDTTPRYNWVPPFPYDGSISDNTKDLAQNMLMMKINRRPNRRMTGKEREMLSLLGDMNVHHYMG